MKTSDSRGVDKFTGVLLGAATGDAMGWPHEGRARRASSILDGRFLERWIKRSGGRFQPHEETIQAGGYSDDTQLIIAVARARLKGPMWWRYLAKIELPFWTLYSRGAGGASLRAARLLLRDILPWESSAVDRTKYFAAGGNGVSMRVAPHALLDVSASSFETVAVNVLADGVLTHGSPVALVGALAYAYALWVALRKTGTLEYGQLLEEVRSSHHVWSELPSIEAIWPSWTNEARTHEYQLLWIKTVEELLNQLDIATEGLARGALDFDEEVMRNMGCYDGSISGAGTVSAAASIFLASKYAVSPMEGVTRAASANGTDTDTIASMTGAILGAVNGTEWLMAAAKGVQDSGFLTDLAKKLWLGKTEEYTLAQDRSISNNHAALLHDLEAGLKDVILPIGSHAKVVGDGGVVTKSEKLQASSWKLEDEYHQTFFIKQLTKRDSAVRKSEYEQSKLQLERVEPPTKGRLAGISLFAKNLTASRHFYGALLGLPITRDTEDLVAIGSNLVLRQNSDVASAGEGTIIYINVDDVRACWQKVKLLPYANASDIKQGTQRPSFLCRDPDGRTIEVFQS